MSSPVGYRLALGPGRVLEVPADRRLVAVEEVGFQALAGSITVAAAYIPPARWEEVLQLLKPLPGPTAGSWKRASDQVVNQVVGRVVRLEGVRRAVEVRTPLVVDRLGASAALAEAARLAVSALCHGADWYLEDVFVVTDASIGTIQQLPAGLAQASLRGVSSVLPTAILAGLLARATRDLEMLAAHAQYPAYALHQNKGLGQPYHLEALCVRGPVRGLHRRERLHQLVQRHYDRWYVTRAQRRALPHPTWLYADDHTNWL